MKILIIKPNLTLEIVELEVLPPSLILKTTLEGMADTYHYSQIGLSLWLFSFKENNTEYHLNAYAPDNCDNITATKQFQHDIIARCKNSELTHITKEVM